MRSVHWAIVSPAEAGRALFVAVRCAIRLVRRARRGTLVIGGGIAACVTEEQWRTS
jgi:hypothetical protein